MTLKVLQWVVTQLLLLLKHFNSVVFPICGNVSQYNINCVCRIPKAKIKPCEGIFYFLDPSHIRNSLHRCSKHDIITVIIPNKGMNCEYFIVNLAGCGDSKHN